MILGLAERRKKRDEGELCKKISKKEKRQIFLRKFHIWLKFIKLFIFFFNFKKIEEEYITKSRNLLMQWIYMRIFFALTSRSIVFFLLALSLFKKFKRKFKKKERNKFFFPCNLCTTQIFNNNNNTIIILLYRGFLFL